MSRVRELPGGGRAVEVSGDRLTGWFDRFSANHGGALRTVLDPQRVEVVARDGARAAVNVPFEPLPPPHGERQGLDVTSLVEHVTRARRIGVLLVRLGGHSVGIARNGQVETSSTDRKPVHGRHKAGGWSQQRFARRREGQARQALSAAADAAARVLLPEQHRLDGLVLGGDRKALEALRADSRLSSLFSRAEQRVLDVGEPRRSVLEEAARRACAVEVEVFEPG